MAHLKGMKEICQYAKRSESTILKLWREADFPITKIHTLSIWESYTEMIDDWNKNILSATIQARTEEVKRPDIATMTAKGRRKKR